MQRFYVFAVSHNKLLNETVKLQVISDAMVLIWHHYDVIKGSNKFVGLGEEGHYMAV